MEKVQQYLSTFIHRFEQEQPKSYSVFALHTRSLFKGQTSTKICLHHSFQWITGSTFHLPQSIDTINTAKHRKSHTKILHSESTWKTPLRTAHGFGHSPSDTTKCCGLECIFKGRQHCKPMETCSKKPTRTPENLRERKRDTTFHGPLGIRHKKLNLNF